MRIKFDAEADALYMRLHEAEIVESEEVSPGVIVDFGGQDRVVGFEVLHFRKRLPAPDLGGDARRGLTHLRSRAA